MSSNILRIDLCLSLFFSQGTAQCLCFYHICHVHLSCHLCKQSLDLATDISLSQRYDFLILDLLRSRHWIFPPCFLLESQGSPFLSPTRRSFLSALIVHNTIRAGRKKGYCSFPVRHKGPDTKASSIMHCTQQHTRWRR